MKVWYGLLVGCWLAGAVGAEEAADYGARLARVETLRKVGQWEMSLTHNGRTNLHRMAIELTYQRPDRFLLRQHNSLLVANGTTLVVQAQMGPLIRYAEAPATNLLNRSELSTLSTPWFRDVQLLLDPYRSGTAEFGSDLERQELNGVPCRIVEVSTREFGSTNMQGRAWVDEETGIIRQAELSGNRADRHIRITLTFSEIAINQELPADAFTYTPPEGARRMAHPDRLFLSMSREAPAKNLGQPAPDFELPLLDGSTFRLSDHTGKVVVIDFWATWCGPCVRALPEMKKISEAFAGREVVLVGVSSDRPASESNVRAVVASNGLTYAIGIDTNRVGHKYGVRGIPTLVAVDPEGLVQFQHVGYDPELAVKMVSVIDQLLAGEKLAQATPLSEEEEAALKEEESLEDYFKTIRVPTLDTNRFRAVWSQTSQVNQARSPAPQVIASTLPPSTYTVLAGSELVVLEAERGELLHRIPIPPDWQPDAERHFRPSSTFLRGPQGGLAVLMEQQRVMSRDVSGNSCYQITGAVLRALSTDGEKLWTRNLPSGMNGLDALPGPDGQERLLVTGWANLQVLDKEGNTLLDQSLYHTSSIWLMESTPEDGWDLLLTGANPGRFHWVEPSPPPEKPTSNEESP